MQQQQLATAQVKCNGNSTAHGAAKPTNAAATLTECSNIYNMASAVTYAIVTAHTTIATAYATATPTKCCSTCIGNSKCSSNNTCNSNNTKGNKRSSSVFAGHLHT